MIEIKNRWSGKVLFRSETANTLRDALIEAVASGSNLSGSNLRDSDLRGSNLRDSNLRGSNLRGSNLRGSDLSGSDLRDSDLRGSNLRGSNLRGSDLSGSDLSGSDLSDSNLRGSNLRGSNLRDSNLRGSNLRGSDLSDSNLRGSNLSGSNLSGSNLRDSNLSGSNLRGSNLTPEEATRERDAARVNHPKVPVVEGLDAAILAEVEAGGKLDMSQWHTCETTHCRAGWAIHKAGEAGKALESRLGPFVAGRLIYLVSTGRRPDFFATNEDALADMRRHAGAV